MKTILRVNWRVRKDGGLVQSTDARYDKGRSGWDQTHVVHATTTYRVPGTHWNNFGDKVTSGWMLSNIIGFSTGTPYSLVTGSTMPMRAGEVLW